MKIAFLADPLTGFKTYKDSTYAMMDEAAKRGHAVYAFEQKDMAFERGMVVANAACITLTGDPIEWYRAEAQEAMPLTGFDAIVKRKDPPFNMEYIYGTYLLELAETEGARIFNKPDALRNHNEKLAILQFPQFIAPTLVTSDEARLRAFHYEHKDVILKPLDGMGGAGVFRIKEDGLNLGSIIEIYFFGLISMLMSRDFKRLGDLAAGTVVVYHERATRVAPIPNLPAIAPPLGLSVAEQRALITFAERSPRLTEARAEELSDLLTPITGMQGRAGAQRLYQMANWLVGKR